MYLFGLSANTFESDGISFIQCLGISIIRSPSSQNIFKSRQGDPDCHPVLCPAHRPEGFRRYCRLNRSSGGPLPPDPKGGGQASSFFDHFAAAVRAAAPPLRPVRSTAYCTTPQASGDAACGIGGFWCPQKKRKNSSLM